jgi:hypothetical protein
MASGRISLHFSGSSTRLAHLTPDGLPFEQLQTPDGAWRDAQAVPNPDQTEFKAVKLVRGIGSSVMLIGLDSSGRLACSAGDEHGNWAENFIWLPTQAGMTFTCFDAVWTDLEGIVVIAVSTANVAYTQSTADGVTWTQPGWRNRPISPYPYPSDPYGVSERYQGCFPPTFTTVAIRSSSPDDGGFGAPVIAGLAPVPNENIPLVLCTDKSRNWQWGAVPAIRETSYHRGTGEKIDIESTPYAAIINDLFFGPALLLLGADGNIYCNVPTDGRLDNWTHDGQPLPNPSGLCFTKAVVAAGYPNSRDQPGKLQVVALSEQDRIPCLIWHGGPDQRDDRSAWNWAGPLPALFPTRKIADLDIATGGMALQVACLATDGTVILNSQDQQGVWHVHGPLK